MNTWGTLLEAVMMILFGFSWPVSIAKSWRARTSKGKSLLFLALILIGYLCGIASKFAAGIITYVLAIYMLNSAMVLVDICLYFRNSLLDRKREKEDARRRETAEVEAETEATRNFTQ